MGPITGELAKDYFHKGVTSTGWVTRGGSHGAAPPRSSPFLFRWWLTFKTASVQLGISFLYPLFVGRRGSNVF